MHEQCMPESNVNQGRTLSRRQLLRKSVVLSATLPAAAILLSACGADDDEPTSTAATGASTPTAADASGTAAGTTPASDTTATVADAATEGTDEATPTSGDAGAVDQDYFGYEIEPAENDSGTAVLLLYYEGSGVNPLYYEGLGGGTVFSPASLIFESLVEMSPVNGEYAPLLATGWEASEDGLEWTFTLREGVTWQDGEPFTADDVVFTYEAHLDPAGQSFAKSYFEENLAGAEALDERTVVLTATETNSEFLGAATEWIVAEHVWAGVAWDDIAADGGSTGEDPSRVVGTGPFILTERIVEDVTRLERNEDYWVSRPNLAEVVFPFTADPANFEPIMRAGDLDWGWVLHETAQEFGEMDHIKLSIFFSLDLVAPVLNLDPERTTVFQDVNVRKALLHGLDRDLMSEAFYFGFAPPATTLLLPDGWSNDAAAVTVRYPYDPELAGQLLDEAGWVMGEDGIRVKDGQPLSFVGVAPKSVEPKLLGMQGYWQEIGVDMETQIILEEQHTEIFNSHDFDLLWLHLWMGGSGYETMRYFFDSSNYPDGGNTGKYSNPRVDELLDQIKAELDPEARIPLFTELQTIILEDLPVLPLVHDMDTRIVHTRLHNVFPNPYRTVFNAETWWVDA